MLNGQYRHNQQDMKSECLTPTENNFPPGKDSSGPDTRHRIAFLVTHKVTQIMVELD